MQRWQNNIQTLQIVMLNGYQLTGYLSVATFLSLWDVLYQRLQHPCIYA